MSKEFKLIELELERSDLCDRFELGEVSDSDFQDWLDSYKARRSAIIGQTSRFICVKVNDRFEPSHIIVKAKNKAIAAYTEGADWAVEFGTSGPFCDDPIAVAKRIHSAWRMEKSSTKNSVAVLYAECGYDLDAYHLALYNSQ